jgi:aryl-alcohol dehydrogenase-like predicted oxidoreductase
VSTKEAPASSACRRAGEGTIVVDVAVHAGRQHHRLTIPEGAERHAFPVGYAFGELAVNGQPRYVRGYAQASLRRLGTDVIDLYYLHFPDPQVPVEDAAGAVADLIGEGLVRHFGLSNVTADELRRAHAVHPVAAVQVEWSMWKPIPRDLLTAADELGAGIVAWSPLGGASSPVPSPPPTLHASTTTMSSCRMRSGSATRSIAMIFPSRMV